MKWPSKQDSGQLKFNPPLLNMNILLPSEEMTLPILPEGIEQAWRPFYISVSVVPLVPHPLVLCFSISPSFPVYNNDRTPYDNQLQSHASARKGYWAAGYDESRRWRSNATKPPTCSGPTRLGGTAISVFGVERSGDQQQTIFCRGDRQGLGRVSGVFHQGWGGGRRGRGPWPTATTRQEHRYWTNGKGILLDVRLGT